MKAIRSAVCRPSNPRWYVGVTHPVTQTGLSDPEVGSYLLERLSRLAATGDVHDVVTELSGVGLGHGAHPSSDASWRHRSDVTYPCSSPLHPGPDLRWQRGSLDLSKRIQLEYFNRFLSRVFSDGDGCEWVLKGGTGILARVPSTRATRDIDLYRQGFTLTQALDELIRLASIDLGDHFRFEYSGTSASICNDTQPYTDGYQVRFTILIGLSAKGLLRVDLAVGAGITGDVTTAAPATALDLPRLVVIRTGSTPSSTRSARP